MSVNFIKKQLGLKVFVIMNIVTSFTIHKAWKKIFGIFCCVQHHSITLLMELGQILALIRQLTST